MKMNELESLVSAKEKIVRNHFESLTEQERKVIGTFMNSIDGPTPQELRKYKEYLGITNQIIHSQIVVSDIALLSITGYINQFEQNYLSEEDTRCQA